MSELVDALLTTDCFDEAGVWREAICSQHPQWAQAMEEGKEQGV